MHSLWPRNLPGWSQGLLSLGPELQGKEAAGKEVSRLRRTAALELSARALELLVVEEGQSKQVVPVLARALCHQTLCVKHGLFPHEVAMALRGQLPGPFRGLLLGLFWGASVPWCRHQTVAATSETERNNWAVLVDSSRYWYNYRHVANVLSFYHTVKRLGIPDSQIILMLPEDTPCNPRNSKPGTVFNEMYHHLNLYGEDVEVDYRGDEVSVDNFLRLLTGRHPPNTPRNKRLLSDSMSNIFIFISGHSGDEFIKFQDWEEITSNDIADAFAQMRSQRRYNKIFWLSDTCQAATLQNKFYSPDIVALGSSGKSENSYSHHVDSELGIAVVDRFTYYALDFLNRLTPSSPHTLKNFQDFFNPNLLKATPELRSDLFSKTPSETLITEFLAATGRMRFQNSLLQLASDMGGTGTNNSCAVPTDDLLGSSPDADWRKVLYAGSVAREPSRRRVEAATAESLRRSEVSGLWELLTETWRQQRPTATFSSVKADDPWRGSGSFGGGGLVAAAPWLLAFVGIACTASYVL